MGGQTEWHIILPLRGLETVACGRMRRTKLRASRMIAKKQRRRPDRERERHIYGWTYNIDWTPMGSFGTHLGG